ncbi:MAG: hypothetical protein NC132_04895 [Corallococcus sp.]|nr:hypothetical protein [Corallococcus sp.]MCM1359725.1 hypothetical protein [Corallococcus sp.]MCM1395434.1 hypothetical protein [Corallococcus sp.]
MNDKIETYIGFAIKKGSAVFGVDSITRYRKKIYLLLATETLSVNSLKTMEEAARKIGCKLRRIPDYGTLKTHNCKAIAICDKQLADAICNAAFGGNNG